MRFVISLLAFLIASPALAVDYTKNIVTDYGAVCQARVVTVDIATSTFIAPNHGLPNDRAVHFFTTGTSPTASIGNTSATSPGAAGTSNVPLATVVGQANGAAVYLTRNVTADTFQIYYKPTSATATTPVTLSGSQSGTFTFDTDARPAFEAFNTWAKTVTTDSNTITLEIPAGSDCVTMTGSATMTSGRIGLGLKKFVMNGNNSIYESYNPQNTGTAYQLTGGGIYEDNIHGARLNYVAKGATSITAIDPTAVTIARGFVVGRWIVITGIDMMGYGFPQNPYYFEYAKITSVNYTTGEIGIDRATQRFYKPTWPHYTDGSQYFVNQGGYAYAYTLYPEWDTDLTYNNLQLRQYVPAYDAAFGIATGGARKVTLNNITILDGGTKKPSGASKTGTDSCLAPSLAREILLTNIQAPLCNGFEIDKIVEYMLIKDSYIGGLAFQSSSFRVVDIDHSQIRTISGTPQIINIKNGSVIGASINNIVPNSLSAGAPFYGRTEQVNCSDSTLYPDFTSSNRIDLNTTGGLLEKLLPESTYFYTISNGVIRHNKFKKMLSVAIDIPSSTFTSPGHGLTANTGIRLKTTGTLPAPLNAGKDIYSATVYYVVDAKTNTFRLSGDATSKLATINTGTSVFTSVGHGMANNTVVTFMSVGNITGMSALTKYYVYNSNTAAGTFQLSQSLNGVNPLTLGGSDASFFEFVTGATNPITLSGSQSGAHEIRALATTSVAWAVPDTNVYFSGVATGPDLIQTSLQAFHVVDVYDDQDYVYIKTDLTLPGWPALATPDTLSIKVHPAPSMTFRNCKGSDIAAELSKAPSGTPLMSYINRTFTADRMKQGAEGINVWGKITSMTTNVVKAWPQSTNFTVWPLSVTGWNIYDATGTRPNYNPVLNSKVEGLRNIFPAPATPRLGDSFPTLAISPPYYVSGGYNIGSQVKSPSMLPIVQLQVTLDQNIIKPTN